MEYFNKTSITTIGSIYTRWGRKSCDGDSSLVHEGEYRCILLTEQCQLNPSICAHSYFPLSNHKSNVKYPWSMGTSSPIYVVTHSGQPFMWWYPSGVRQYVPDEFISGVLDYNFAVGVLGLGYLDFGLWTSFGDDVSLMLVLDSISQLLYKLFMYK